MPASSILRFVLLLVFLCGNAFAYERPSNVDEAIWEKLSPYFLPDDHPIKQPLDALFKHSRISSTLKSLKKAGFRVYRGRKWDNVYVALHKKLKGYILKIFTDDQMGINEWDIFLRRTIGSRIIRDAIKSHNYTDIFSVPKKWIYPLPEKPAANPLYQRKNFILIAEDMHVLSDRGNQERWIGPFMTPEKLAAIFVMIRDVGLVDSVFPDNIPFCRNGKLSFIDTEHYHTWPIPYHRLLHYLSPQMQNYWLLLIQNNGP